jgi:hypothetical protein
MENTSSYNDSINPSRLNPFEFDKAYAIFDPLLAKVVGDYP